MGKTYTIDKFGKENFEQYLYFNLEKNDEVRNIFKTTIDEEKILQELELYIGKKIDLDKTLLFFDEVQVSENFIVSLKYFNESKKPYKIVCAGSLLRSKDK
ncbi:MAG: AAA family ATPase [Clostridia bacterium]|nr:AAA family ATPase [Clostridia bacterium]